MEMLLLMAFIIGLPFAFRALLGSVRHKSKAVDAFLDYDEKVRARNRAAAKFVADVAVKAINK